MFKIAFRLAVRTILKQKLPSFINIIGLTLGIAACVLIYLYVRNERNFDTFHENSSRLYRACITEDPPNRNPITYVEAPFHLAEALEQSLPETERAVRLDVRTDTVRRGDAVFTERYHLADPDFFQVFTFPLVRGDKAQVFRDPDAVVLTESEARKIFGRDDPLGRRLSIRVGQGFHDFAVTGIAKDPPSNSSINFTMVIPFENIHTYISDRALDNWFNVYFETYVLLDRPVEAAALEAKLKAVVRTHYPSEDADQVTVRLQPITDIHLDPSVPNGFEPASDPRYSLILAGIAVLILAAACVNFMTLAVGRSAGRAKEVGVRKVLGAQKAQLVRQFLGEAILLSFSATVLGVVLAELLLPAFNAVMNRTLVFAMGPWTVAFLAGLALFAGVAAGAYPALVLSRPEPVSVMKREPVGRGRNLLVRGLVVGQFAVSIGLVICTFLMGDQLRFLLHKDLGFRKDNVVVLRNFSEGPQSRAIVERLRTTLSGRPGILGVAGASSTFAKDWASMGFTALDGSFKQFFELTVDYDYLKTMGMTLVEGRNFSREFGADPGGALIVNEAFLHYFGWTSGLEKTLPGRRFPAHRIIGVVRDFNFQSLRSEVRPVALVLDPTLLLKGINDLSISSPPSQLNFVNIRVAGGDMAGTLDLLRRSWKETAPDEPFQFSFLDQDVERQYRDIARWGQVLGFASGFTILIACLGLFGLAALSVARRTREIGIRKVLGASPASIITMFAREFSGLVIAANLIAWPLAFLAMRKWLENFAYRSSLDVLKFPVAGLLALVVALVTVAVQSVKAALSDPAETTRYE